MGEKWGKKIIKGTITIQVENDAVAWTKAVEWNLGYMLKVELGRLASKLDEKSEGKGI